jgi:hypothetical protein
MESCTATAVRGVRACVSLGLFGALIPVAALAQQPLPIHRVTSPVQLDGRSDEDAWRGIDPLPLVAHQPTFGAPPAERSEIRLAYDAEYLYAAARFYVSDASDVRAASLYRDRPTSDDIFRLLLDTFNDNENALVFEVTPAGVRADHSISDDGRGVNTSWNAYWDVATSRTAEGWFAEIRIPFSSLRFQPVDGRVVMGLIAARFSVSTQELVTFPALSPEYSNAFIRPSIAAKISLEGVESRNPLYIMPYALGGLSRAATLDPTTAAFRHEQDFENEAGLDVKYGITSNLTLDASLNTDFAQVEADDQQVNLTRFSLFFPEKRQFFQERSGVFSFNTGNFGDASRLFHSRRIGLTDDGRPLRIYGGGRLVGRVGAWDIGALNMHVDGDGSMPSENFGTLRLRRQLLNSGSYVGAIATSRIAGGGVYNIAYGLDTQLRAFRNDFLTLQWAQTFDDDTARVSGLDAAMVRAIWERRSAQGVVYSAWAKWSGPAHSPGLGFAPRSDFTTYGANLRYGWYPGERTIFNNIQPSLLAGVFRRNADNELESATVNVFLNWALKSGWFGYFVQSNEIEDLPVELVLAPDATVPAGRHEWRRIAANFFPPSRPRLRMSLSTSLGGFYDGDQFTATLGPTWSASEHLEIAGEYSFNRIRLPDRGQRLNADIARLHIQAALDAHLSATTFLQYSDAGGLAIGNIRVRYHLSEGRDLFLVYNERLNTERDGLDPRPPLSQDRTLVVKYSHAFVR